MYIATIVLSILLGLAFLLAAMAKVRRQEPVTGTLESLGVGPAMQRTIGVLELLGGIGVAVGLTVQPLGIAAAVGLVLVMIGALIFHARAHDSVKSSTGAFVLLVLAGVVTALQVATV